jgi:hypothetical protein
MDRETGFAQMLAQLCLGLTQQLHMVSSVAHGLHFFENAPFLAPECHCRLSVQYTQRFHQ